MPHARGAVLRVNTAILLAVIRNWYDILLSLQQLRRQTLEKTPN